MGEVALNNKHKLVIDYFMRGYKIADAYSKVYEVPPNAAANINGNRLLKREDVIKYIAENKDKFEEAIQDDVWSMDEILLELRGIAENSNIKPNARIQAMKLGAYLITTGAAKQSKLLIASQNNNIQEDFIEVEAEEDESKYSDEELKEMIKKLKG